jgi:hypothetical protein
MVQGIVQGGLDLTFSRVVRPSQDQCTVRPFGELSRQSRDQIFADCGIAEEGLQTGIVEADQA